MTLQQNQYNMEIMGTDEPHQPIIDALFIKWFTKMILV